MSPTTWAAFLKPIIGPVLIFASLLLVRWIAVVILRVLPDGKVRRVLFDKTLLDRHLWLYAALFILANVVFWSYVVYMSPH